MGEIRRESKSLSQRPISSPIFPWDSACTLHPLPNWMSSSLHVHCHGHLALPLLGNLPTFCFVLAYLQLFDVCSIRWWFSCLTLLSHHLAQSLIWSRHLIKKKKKKVVMYSCLTKPESESEVAWSCPAPCDPMDCSLPGFSVHGIFQARVLEWVATPFSRGSSQPRDRTQVSRIAGRRFTLWATREAPYLAQSLTWSRHLIKKKKSSNVFMLD